MRFELSIAALNSAIEIIAPWRDEEFTSRLDKVVSKYELTFYYKVCRKKRPFRLCREELHSTSCGQVSTVCIHLIQLAEPAFRVTRMMILLLRKSPWSMDANLMHISYEAGILEDPNVTPPSRMWLMTTDPIQAPDNPDSIVISFQNGLPIAVVHDDKTITGSLEIYQFLNQIAGKHGVGRLDIVESRFVGMKSRGCYETPAGTVLLVAHRDLEGITTDREVLEVKSFLSKRFSTQVYNGLWFREV